MDMDYDPRFQDSKDGPLKKEVRDRLGAFRPDATLADIGRAIGFSGAFVSQLLNTRNPGRVRSLHVPRIIAALEAAERERGQTSAPRPDPGSTASGELTLADHIRAIDALGFTVTLTPKKGT